MEKNSKIILSSGNIMPVLGLGTWQLTENTADAVEHALHLGYRMIDTSGDYGTQPGISDGILQSGVLRSEIYIVSKVEETDDAYEYVRKNLDELKLRYADLMLIHRPPKEEPGLSLWKGLIRAKEEGLVRDIGVSNYPPRLIDALIEATGVAPVVNQIEWSPFGCSEEMLRYADQKKMVIQAYSPLTRAKRLDDETLVALAAKYGKTPAQILIRWNLERGIVPLPKASDPDHRVENINVFDFKLEAEDMARLNGMNENYSALGKLPYV